MLVALVLAMAAGACEEPPARTAPTPTPTAAPTTPRDGTEAPVTAATTVDEPSTRAGGGTFRFATTPPSTLVPPSAVALPDLQVVDALFDSLTAWDDDLEPEASAAVAWQRDETATTWTFTLRAGATFHDGAPVTAEDYAASWAVAVAEGGAGYLLRHVLGYAVVEDGAAERLAGVQVLDDRTLQVRLGIPTMDFPSVVAHPGLGPLQRAAWAADRAAYEAQPIGNGPFVATEALAPGQFLRTARFEGWRNGARPPLDGVLFQISDVDTSFLAFRQGRRDFAPVPPGALAQARREFPAQPDPTTGPGLLVTPVPTTYLLGFDVTQPPFDDVEVRRAVALALDREAVAATLLDGNLDPAESVVPPAIAGGAVGACDTCRFDPVAASRTFADLGITRLPYWYNRGGGHDEVAALLRRSLGRIGVRLETNGGEAAPDFETYLAGVRSGAFGMFRWGWSPEVPVLDEALRPLFHSSSTPAAGGQNVFGYARPLVDRLLDRAREMPNETLRRRLYQQVERIVLAEQVVVPVVSFRHAAVAGDRVRELRYGAMGLVDLAEVSLDRSTSDGSS